jgi:nitric oxide reductase subunit B
MFFLAVSFWNLVGAGLFGFLINPPLSLYYMQGLNLTAAAWPHRAVRRLRHARHRPDAVLPARPQADVVWIRSAARRSRSGPQHRPGADGRADPAADGHLQLLAAIEHGYWYARSAEFMQKPIVEMLVWMRVPGDTIFSVGALALVLVRAAFSGSAEHECGSTPFPP